MVGRRRSRADILPHRGGIDRTGRDPEPVRWDRAGHHVRALASTAQRREFWWATRTLLLGVVIGGLLAVPIFYVALRHGAPKIPVVWIRTYSGDLTNVITPTGIGYWGTIRSLTRTWFGNAAENIAFIPIPMLLFLLVYTAFRRTRLVLGAMLFAFLALVLSFGPTLPFAGTRTSWMPWALFLKIPGLNDALPDRCTGFMFIALLVVLADALARPGKTRWIAAPRPRRARSSWSRPANPFPGRRVDLPVRDIRRPVRARQRAGERGSPQPVSTGRYALVQMSRIRSIQTFAPSSPESQRASPPTRVKRTCPQIRFFPVDTDCPGVCRWIPVKGRAAGRA